MWEEAETPVDTGWDLIIYEHFTFLIFFLQGYIASKTNRIGDLYYLFLA